jgi:uncharacterized membrane protein
MSPVETILLHSFLNFLLLGSGTGLIVGAILILRPNWLERASAFCNRWISTRQLNRKLESSIPLDAWFYRYNRMTGGATLVGALYILYFFTVRIDKSVAIVSLSKRFHVPSAYIATLIDPLVLIALLGATFALVISLFVCLRPSLLRDFEQRANQWISLRSAMKPLEIQRNGVDELVFRHARHVGVMLVLGSIYTLALLTLWAR